MPHAADDFDPDPSDEDSWSDTDDFDDEDYEDFLRRESLDGPGGGPGGGSGDPARNGWGGLSGGDSLPPVWKWTAWGILIVIAVAWVGSALL